MRFIFQLKGLLEKENWKKGEEENHQRNNKMKFSELSRLKGATERTTL